MGNGGLCSWCPISKNTKINCVHFFHVIRKNTESIKIHLYQCNSSIKVLSTNHFHQVHFCYLEHRVQQLLDEHSKHISPDQSITAVMQTDQMTPEAHDSCAMCFTRSKTKALFSRSHDLNYDPHPTPILLTPFDFTGENTVHVVVISMPTLRVIINIPKPIKIYASKKTVLLYDRSSQPPVIVSQMSFIIPLENFICGKYCVFIKPLTICLQIPFNFEYINDINRCSLWKKCWDTASYSKLVPYPMLNMLALLILATLSPALQGNLI